MYHIYHLTFFLNLVLETSCAETNSAGDKFCRRPVVTLPFPFAALISIPKMPVGITPTCPLSIYCTNLFPILYSFYLYFYFSLFIYSLCLFIFAFILYVCLTLFRCQWRCNRIGSTTALVHTSVKAQHPIFIHSYLKMRMHFHSHIPIGIGIR